MNQRHTRLLVWIAFLLCATCVSLWPSVAGMIVMNDDMKFLRSPACEMPLLEELRIAWTGSPSFRPMEILMGRLCDPITLACPWVMPLQVAGFAMLAGAVVRLSAIVMPGEAMLAPLALILVAVSPATTCAMWQMDACSQTWSAALGLWACVHAWRGGIEAKDGRWPWRHATWLLLAFLPLLLVKETAYGWSLGIGTCQLAVAGWRLSQDRRGATRMLLPAVPAILIPLAFLTLRIALGAIGRSLEGDDGSRYQVEFGMNTLVNLALSTGAAFATGPFHTIGNDQASILLRGLPLVAAVLLGLPVAAALERVLFRERGAERSSLERAGLLLVASSGSVLVTSLTQSVSELYGLGLNAAFGILIGCALLSTPRMTSGFPVRGAMRWSTGVALAIGLFGVISRAHHFGITWRMTKEGNGALIAALDAATSAGKPPRQITACFDASCRPPYRYGQYLIPLQQSMDIPHTVPWAMRRWPGIVLSARYDRPCDRSSPGVVPMPCAGMSSHGNW